MASITDIVQVENSNCDTIYLYQEGIFYKAYEHSAWLFVTYVRPFSVKCRLVKVVGCMVVSTGFPMSSAERFFVGCECLKEGKLLKVKLSGEQKFDETKYLLWKQTAERQVLEVRSVGCLSASCDTDLGEKLLVKLRAFPIERKTPMECMLFLSELKHISENDK